MIVHCNRACFSVILLTDFDVSAIESLMRTSRLSLCACGHQGRKASAKPRSRSSVAMSQRIVKAMMILCPWMMKKGLMESLGNIMAHTSHMHCSLDL